MPQRGEPGGDPPCWSVHWDQLYCERALGQQELLYGETEGAADRSIEACVLCFINNHLSNYISECPISVGIYHVSPRNHLTPRAAIHR